MNTILEIPKLPERLVLDPPLTDDEFERMSVANELVTLERTKEGTIVVNPPTGADTDKGNTEIIYQLRAWWKQRRLGAVFGSSAGFFLRDGACLSPDAAYATAEQMRGLNKKDREHFLHLAPAFVIELLSHSDNLPKAKEKMENWMANGSHLGWLIDPYRRDVTIYEASNASRLETAEKVIGTGPVEGFVLDLTAVWSEYED